MRETTVKKIIDYFNNNEDLFNSCMEELDNYNGYGNLVSCDYKDYTAQLDKYAVEAMSENRQYIDTIENNNELNALFDELEQDENEEE